MSALTAIGLHRRYGQRIVVRDLHLTVAPGEIVGLLGPNGAGKTTSFRMLAGLLTPHGGRVRLGDRDITPLPLHRRARLGLGYLPQEPSIFRQLSVINNLEIALRHLPRPERRAQAAALLERFGLTHLTHARPDTLSGGERRRIEILRAFAAAPQVLLVDEPFAGLDPRAAADVARELSHLAHLGVGVLITDHRVEHALRTCHRVDILAEGEVIFSGGPAEAMADPRVRRVYLG